MNEKELTKRDGKHSTRTYFDLLHSQRKGGDVIAQVSIIKVIQT